MVALRPPYVGKAFADKPLMDQFIDRYRDR